jgi:hypothetical protein
MPKRKEMTDRKSVTGADSKVGIFWIDIKGLNLALVFSEPVRGHRDSKTNIPVFESYKSHTDP